MAASPVLGGDTPVPDPSGLTTFDAGNRTQTAAVTPRSRDLALALAAMGDQAQDLRAPDSSPADLLANALLQRRYGPQQYDGQLTGPGPQRITWPVPTLAGTLQDHEVTFDDLIPGQNSNWPPSFLGSAGVGFGHSLGNGATSDWVKASPLSAGEGLPGLSNANFIPFAAIGVGSWNGSAGLMPDGRSAKANNSTREIGSSEEVPVGDPEPRVITNDGTDLGASCGVDDPGDFVSLNYEGGMPPPNRWPAGMTRLYGAIRYIPSGNRYFVFAGPDGSPQRYAVEYWTGAGERHGGGAGRANIGSAPVSSDDVAPMSSQSGGMLDGLHGALSAASFVPELGSVALGLDAGLSAGQAAYDLASGNSRKASGELGAAGISAAAAGIGLFDGDAGATRAVEQAAAEGIKAAESAPQSVESAVTHIASSPTAASTLERGEISFGPHSPQSALSGNRTYPDPVPGEYAGRMSPDTPVHDHNLAQALGGHPTDPENIDLRAWAENARKGAFEGQYLRDRARLIAGGLTEEQAEWVLEDQLRWIQTDIHASPVDPTILDRLPSQ